MKISKNKIRRRLKKTRKPRKQSNKQSRKSSKKEKKYNKKHSIKKRKGKRKSIKFWVRKENVLPVICNILPNLPIHLWDEDINEHIYQMTSSVYLDNSHLDCYNERINK